MTATRFRALLRNPVLLGTLIAGTAGTAAVAQEAISSEKASYRTRVVAEGLASPWGFDFLPDGSVIVTEKAGKLRLVGRDGKLSEPIAGVPAVDARKQGGLLDVAVHPRFAENRLVYLSFSEPAAGLTSTAVARARLSADGRALEDVKVIFSQRPKVDSVMHYGSRIVFDGKGHVFVGLGERSEERFRGQAQDLNSHLGKVVRLNEDGTVPDDNPFVGRKDAKPEIWSYGHRNIQAAALDPKTGKLWTIEHGPRGGDEVNVPEAGGNYGWPVVSFGVNYDGTPVGTGKAEASGMLGPVKQWTPVIAPSGATFYDGSAFPAWNGNLFVGGLVARALVRLEIADGKVVREERILRELGERIRDVQQGPDGALWVVTDGQGGKLVRIQPAAAAGGGATGAPRP